MVRLLIAASCCVPRAPARAGCGKDLVIFRPSDKDISKHFADAGELQSSAQLGLCLARPAFVVSPLQQVERCSHIAMRLFLYALTTCAGCAARPRRHPNQPRRPSASGASTTAAASSRRRAASTRSNTPKRMWRGDLSPSEPCPTPRSPPCARRTRGPCPARSWRGGARARAPRRRHTRAPCGLVPDALQLLAAPRDFCRRHRSTGRGAARRGCARHPAARRARRRRARRGGPTARRSSSAASTRARASRGSSGRSRRVPTSLRRGRRADGGRARRVDHRGPERAAAALATSPTAPTRPTRRPSRPRRRRRRTGATPSRRTPSSPCCGPRAA